MKKLYITSTDFEHFVSGDIFAPRKFLKKGTHVEIISVEKNPKIPIHFDKPDFIKTLFKVEGDDTIFETLYPWMLVRYSSKNYDAIIHISNLQNQIRSIESEIRSYTNRLENISDYYNEKA